MSIRWTRYNVRLCRGVNSYFQRRGHNPFAKHVELRTVLEFYRERTFFRSMEGELRRRFSSRWWAGACGQCCPWQSRCRMSYSANRLCLYQHRDHRSSIQRKRPVIESSQNRKLARVARNGDVSATIRRKHIIKNFSGPDILIRGNLTEKRFPEQILLRESLLNRVPRKILVDIRSVTAAIASMPTDALPQQLFDLRDKRVPEWEVKL